MFNVTPTDLINFLLTEKGIVEPLDTAKLIQLMCRKCLYGGSC